MKQLIKPRFFSFFLGFLFLLSCSKNVERLNYKLAGPYSIDLVEYTEYNNGEVVSSSEKADVGFLELRFEGGGNIQTHSGRFVLNDGVSLISLNDQLAGTETFDWSIDEEKRIAMLANDPFLTFPYALTFTVEEADKKTGDKRFIYVRSSFDADGNSVQEVETLHLRFLQY